MPVPYWPPAMRQTPQRDSWTGGPQDARAKFEPDYGPPLMRRRTTAETELWQGVFPNLNATMRAAFRSFWADDIAGGALSFAWRDPVTDEVALWRITGSGERAYDMSHGGAGLSDLSLQMMRLPGVPWWGPAVPEGRSIVPIRALAFQAGLYGRPPIREQLSALMTLTRASSATYVDPAGVVQSVAANVPRVDANGLLLEAAATNRLTFSEQFDNVAWSKTRTTVTANAVAAPNGTSTADKLVETAISGTHFCTFLAGGLATNTVHTFSVFVRAGERTNGSIRLDSLSDIVQADFQLGAGTIQGSVSGAGVLSSVGIEPLAGGWFRVRVSGLPNTTASSYGCQINLRDAADQANYTGDGTSGLFVWGAQLEQGPAASSYVQTTTAQVTRSADAAALVQAITAQDLRIISRSGAVTDLPATTIAAGGWPAAAAGGARSVLVFPAGAL